MSDETDPNQAAILKFNELASNSGNAAIKALMLINGGAAVAILAFVGNAISRSDAKFPIPGEQLASSLTWFAWGVAAATLAGIFAYLNTGLVLRQVVRNQQPEAGRRRFQRIVGEAFVGFGLISALASLALFGKGVLEASTAIAYLTASQ